MKDLTGHTAIIVDGHPLWLDAMARLLRGGGVDVVAKSTDPSELVALVDEHGPDVLVVGLGAGPADAELLEAIPDIRRGDRDVRVVILAPTCDARAVDAALSMGVSAYCMKSAEPDDLMAAIRQSFEQSIFLATSRGARPTGVEAPGTWRRPARVGNLTPRETEILRLVAEGYSNSKAAEMLWVTEQTVKFHLSNIYKKLQVANRTEASRWAQLHGLLPATETEMTPSAA
jgi:DNA-binding NarL/FixJ family response regulator